MLNIHYIVSRKVSDDIRALERPLDMLESLADKGSWAVLSSRLLGDTGGDIVVGVIGAMSVWSARALRSRPILRFSNVGGCSSVAVDTLALSVPKIIFFGT